MNPASFDDLFVGQRVMAVLRGLPPEETVHVAARAWDLGITVVEVPVQTPDALPSLRAAVSAGRERGLTVGAGTVVSLAQVEGVASAGAGFTVAPGIDLAVAEASAAQGMPHLPGVATPTDVQRATTHGLVWLKAFPAALLGTAWFGLLHGPFPHVRFVATGGIDAYNAGSFLDVGVHVVGVGSALAAPAQMPLLAELNARSGTGREDGTGARA